VARIKAILRRKGPAGWKDNPETIEYDQFYLNPANQTVVIRGQTVELTSAEFRLLKVLASNPGRVFTRAFTGPGTGPGLRWN
jgi:DNA-binding response OmpR family regulator